jgi:Dockerin type I domain
VFRDNRNFFDSLLAYSKELIAGPIAMLERETLLKSKRRKSQTRRLLHERLEVRSLLAGDWQNPINRLDVDDSGLVTPLDALVVINSLVREGIRTLDAPSTGVAPPPFPDVNGNDFIEPLDALIVINHLNMPLTARDSVSLQRFHVDVTTAKENPGLSAAQWCSTAAN